MRRYLENQPIEREGGGGGGENRERQKEIERARKRAHSGRRQMERRTVADVERQNREL